MTTERLNEFKMLASVLNYSRAAERLFISQSVLSRHIKELEKELGGSLFSRDTHSVSLTEEGKYLYSHVESLLDKAEHLTSVVSINNADADGVINLRCQEQTLCTFVLNFIEDFKARYTDIELQVHPIIGKSSISHLDDADILLSPCDFTDTMPPDTKAEYITSQEALLAIPPYHHLGDAHEISLKELRGESLLVPFADEMFGPYAANAYLAYRRTHSSINRIPVPTPEEALLSAELGLGVMILPHHLKRLIYPHTRTLRIKDTDCSFPVYAYYRTDPQNPAVILFIESLHNQPTVTTQSLRQKAMPKHTVSP